ncbi:Excinuclease ABC subunit C [uncultured Roseburia sp.]|uniref:UvrABC system protein C n=1 Tax=Brotonthovivens ammoniilytica TaxID=2981725 RepID=A0ABT2TM17_9FIRM|nr:excinuclease ABC subunit UvrC [Brotonthovivens ammoniilytica]MCU6763263.1 excinuclease ABC subunit UvrC [Brotonthovivens ammoniilytica]SCJ11260.1 Excinuclease ABC subunit C [uncultured Roseburia sp.]
MFDIQEELKKLPGRPGVYIMHDSKDAIIYVGKAVSLKNRVRQYFQSSRNKGPKIEKMVTQVSYFEYIITDSELEALVLECNLIKEHRPKYNTMLKDDKTYPYIKVTLGETYPRVLFSRTMKKDKSRYFGPYTSAGAVKDTIELLCKLYCLRTCSRSLPRDIKKERPCLNYHIHQCMAPCQGYITPEDYQERIRQAVSFLNGNYQPVIKMLEEKMQKASEDMEFEKAIEYRELLNSVKAVAQKQKITSSDGEDRDVLALAMDERDAVVQVFFVRDGRLIGREHFHVTIANEDTKEQILGTFLKQYYAGTPFIPKEIILPCLIEEEEIIAEWLTQRRGQKVYIRVPRKGSREKLVELAAQNARLVLNQDREKIRREEGRTIGAAKEIASLLGLSDVRRMEAFDISNTNGFESVGSMVVYEKGKPCRSDYRRFKLKTVTGPDDYASMHEVLTRRFTHGLSEQKQLREKDVEEKFGSFTKFPDLILMDGGKGQVNIALKVLDELKLTIPVCGMVKDDFHRTRGLYFENREIPIDKSSEGFKLITRIQDEAHRFAIEYHRSLRSKEQVHSVLDDIPGIGPARRKALMRSFQSLDAIRQAEIQQLLEIPEMNQKAARAVYDFFHVIKMPGELSAK